MLDRERRDIFEQIKYKIENDMNNNMDYDGTYLDNNDYWAQQWDNDGTCISAPNEIIGWPPGLAKYIKRVSLMMAKEILDSVLTEHDINYRKQAELHHMFHKLNVK